MVMFPKTFFAGFPQENCIYESALHTNSTGKNVVHMPDLKEAVQLCEHSDQVLFP